MELPIIAYTPCTCLGDATLYFLATANEAHMPGKDDSSVVPSFSANGLCGRWTICTPRPQGNHWYSVWAYLRHYLLCW